MTKCLDLAGKVFGNLTVVERVDNSSSGKSQWKYVCTCGCEFISGAKSSKNKYLSCKSCASKKQGYESRKYNDLENYKPVYQSWRGMKERCSNPNNSHYKDYGALGIKVCERWSHETEGFINFYNDMGQRPSGKTLDRINVYGGYCAENCRWADLTTQAYNTKRTHLNKSGRIGVRYEKRNGKDKWIAYISYQNKMIYLGIHKSFNEACKVREDAELEYYGVTKQV
jgi:hypothetical protein